MINRLLERQLKKFRLDYDTPPDAKTWREFLDKVGHAYEQADQDRNLLERSLTISSREMRELNEELEQRVIERTEALRESERRLRALFESSPDAIFVEDLEGNVLDVNYAACRLHGMERDELIGKNVAELVPPERREQLFGDFQAQISGDVNRLESVSWAKDGRAIPVEISINQIDYSGQPALLLHVRDITDRKQAEEALREGEKQYQRIVENIQDGLTIIEGREVAYVNERVCEIFGYSAEELAKINPLDLAVPEEKPRLQRIIAEARREGTMPTELEYWIVRKDGTRRYIRNRYSISHREDQIVGRYVFTTDLTDRKLVEDSLRQAEERYRGFFENAVFGMYQTTPNGSIISLNPELAHICGYRSAGEMIGAINDISRDFYVDPNRRTEFSRILEEEEVVSGFESRIYRKDGRVVWISEGARTVRDDDGDILYYEGVVIDITERKQTEEALRESERKFRLLFDRSPDAMLLLDGDKFVDCNPAAVRMLRGASKEEILSLTPAQLSPKRQPDGRSSIEKSVEMIEKAFAQGTWRFEWIHVRTDGEEFPVEVTLTSVPLEGKQILYTVWRDITEQKRAEVALKESERRLSDLVDFLPDAILAIDRDGEVSIWNRAMEALTGVAAEDIVGKGNYEYAVPFYGEKRPLLVDLVLEPIEEIEHKYENVTKLDDKLVGETYVPNLRGESRYLFGTAAKLYDSKGEVVGAIEIIRDITERKQTEAALQESQRSLLTLMSNLPGMAYRCRNEPNWPMEFVSEGCVELTGYQSRDLMDGGEITFGELTHPDDREYVWNEIQGSLREGQPFQVTYRIITATGEEKWLWGQGRGVFSPEGDVEALEGFITDITERRQAEEQLHRLSLALEQSGDGIAITDLEGTVQFVNDAWVRMHQYFDATELIGKHLGMFHTAEQLERREDLPSEQAKRRGVYSGEVEHLRRDGTVFPTAMTVTLLHDEAGQPTGLIASARDITAERHLRDISQGLATAMTLHDVVDVVIEPVARIAGADRGMVILFEDWIDDEPTVTRMLAVWDLPTKKVIMPNRKAPYEQYQLGRAIREAKDIILIDDMDDPLLTEVAPKLKDLGVQSVAIMPWISRERVIGFSLMERRQDMPFDYANLQAAQTAVNQSALAVSSIQQLEERQRELQDAAERRATEVATGTEIAQAIAAVPALDVLYETVVTLIQERFDYYHTQIFRYEPGVNAVVLVVGYGEIGKKMKEAGHKLEMGRGVVGTAAATGEPQLAADVTEDPAWRPNPNLPDTKGELAVPISLRGEVLGVLDVQSDEAGALAENDLILLQGICGQIAAAIESTQLRQETERRLREISTLYRDYTRAAWDGYQQERKYEKANAYIYDGITVVPEETVPEGAVVPLMVRGEVIGRVGVAEDPNRVWTEEEIALLETVAEQVAQTMERGRLFEQTQRTLEETQSLYEASRSLIAAPDEQAVIQRLVENLDVRTLDRVVVAMVVGVQDGQRLVEVRGVWDRAGQEELFLGNRFSAEQIPLIEQVTSTQLYLFNDVNTSTEMDDISRATFNRLGVKSLAVLPMTVGEELLGWILLETTKSLRTFTREQMQPYLALANQAAIAIQNRRLFQSAQRRAQRERMIREITAKMRASTDLDTILNTAVEELGKSLGVSRTFVRLTTGVDKGNEGDEKQQSK